LQLERGESSKTLSIFPNQHMNDVLDLFRRTGALLNGHFILRSGLHSRQFFQCALLLQDAAIAAQICGRLADKLEPYPATTVISPAVGGIIVGQEVARHLGKRHIFAEKDGSGRLVLRRGFVIGTGERFLLAEDVVTRGGRLQETIQIVRDEGGIVAAAGAIVDRSGGSLPDFGCPFVSLVQMDVETFAAENLPPDLAATPAVKPGSK
jgi:orotate phosphoribosyltransferase